VDRPVDTQAVGLLEIPSGVLRAGLQGWDLKYEDVVMMILRAGFNRNWSRR